MEMILTFVYGMVLGALLVILWVCVDVSIQERRLRKRRRRKRKLESRTKAERKTAK